MAKRRKVANLMALALLALLVPGRPMHPYEMAVLLRRTGKEQDMKIKCGSLYTVVQNLEKYGYIQATDTSREGRRPERTRYALTDTGLAELRDWLRELVAEPEKEYPRFEAALSVIGVLPPEQVIPLLEQRLRSLELNAGTRRAGLAQAAEQVPRVFLIESEYALAISDAEAAWIRSLLGEMAAGSLSGMAEWRHWHEAGGDPPEWTRLLEDMGVPTD